MSDIPFTDDGFIDMDQFDGIDPDSFPSLDELGVPDPTPTLPDDGWGDIEGFFQKVAGGMPPADVLTVLRDPTAGDDDAKTLRHTFGTTAIPDSYVVMNGRVVARFVNTRDWTDSRIVEYLQRLAPKR